MFRRMCKLILWHFYDTRVSIKLVGYGDSNFRRKYWWFPKQFLLCVQLWKWCNFFVFIEATNCGAFHHWSRIHIVASSTGCQIIWFKGVLEGMNLKHEGPTTLYYGNSSVIFVSKFPVLHRRTKHIRLRFLFKGDC